MSGTDEQPGDRPPKIRPLSAAMDVPVFNIVLHVAHVESGVRARVANLPDLCFEASSEPAVLKKAITEVKSQLATWHRNGEPIPWVDPVPALAEGEQERWVPVHL